MVETGENNMRLEIENILISTAQTKGLVNFDVNFDLEMSVGDGFVSNFYKGDIIDKDTGEILNVVIKKTPTWEFDYQPLFQNEIIFYTKIYPALSTLYEQSFGKPLSFAPNFIISGSQPKKEFLVLEDLKTQGYVLTDKSKYLDKEHLEHIFKVYGIFHALSFVLRKQSTEYFEEINNGLKDSFELFITNEEAENTLRECFIGAVEALDEESKERDHFCKMVEHNISRIFMRLASYNGQYKCSTHGDCWSNNFLFKYMESGQLKDVKALDFQLTRVGTPVHDLSYFFYASAEKESLDQLEYYLKLYHESLSSTITTFGSDPEEIFPYNVLIQEWRKNAFFGVILGIMLWQTKLLSKEEILEGMTPSPSESEEENKARVMKHFDDLREKVLSGDPFKTRAKNILLHSYEFGLEFDLSLDDH